MSDPQRVTWVSETERRRRLSAAVLLAAAALALTPNTTDGRDIWVVRFSSAGPIVDPPCGYLAWYDQVVLHNTGPLEQAVRLLGLSNGGRRADAIDVVIPPGRTRTVSGTAFNWYPDPWQSDLWVNHLDVPAPVLVSTRLGVGTTVGSPCPITADSRGLGATAFPLFTELSATNKPQYHLATDLGAARNGRTAPIRLNVGVYNAGGSPATARIEVYQSCDDVLTASRVISVPANSIVQSVGVPHDVGPTCHSEPYGATSTSSYVIVTVNQPSFSYVVSLSNDALPTIPIGISITR